MIFICTLHLHYHFTTISVPTQHYILLVLVGQIVVKHMGERVAPSPALEVEAKERGACGSPPRTEKSTTDLFVCTTKNGPKFQNLENDKKLHFLFMGASFLNAIKS